MISPWQERKIVEDLHQEPLNVFKQNFSSLTQRKSRLVRQGQAEPILHQTGLRLRFSHSKCDVLDIVKTFTENLG